MFYFYNFAQNMKPDILLQRVSEAFGITKLTAMQERMLSLRDTNDNIVVTAPTGSGKTLGFTLNVTAAMGKPESKVRTVVIVPSRELALQVGEVIRRLTAGVYKTTVCYGGHPFVEEERSLAAGTDIVVATPGRLLDHINRRTIEVTGTHYLVLDEYDKSLELGFAEDMRRIVRSMPEVWRVIMTSATRISEWPGWLPVRQIVDVTEDPGDYATCQRRHDTEVTEVRSYDRDKLSVLNDLLRADSSVRSIVFVNHRESAERVYTYLSKLGFPVGLYHGGLEQTERENALEMFVNGTTPVLVSTDLGARGLDIIGLDNVIHYHMPTSEQAWIHRNGRTGRMGGVDGKVYVIVSEDENVPEYVITDRSWCPPAAPSGHPDRASMATLWFCAGKKDKISKGDIVGFLTQQAGIPSADIKRILLRDHNALVAVSRGYAQQAVETAAKSRVKGKKVRVTRLG